MTSLVMMRIGEFKFGLSTAAYQNLERDTAWRWPTIDSVGAAPRPQFVGKGEDTVRLSGIVYPHFANAGLEQIETMRAQANQGEPLLMVCGRGRFWGWWAITSIREGQRVFWSNGAPRAQEFELALLFYSTDDPQDIRRAYVKKVEAIRREREPDPSLPVS